MSEFSTTGIAMTEDIRPPRILLIGFDTMPGVWRVLSEVEKQKYREAKVMSCAEAYQTYLQGYQPATTLGIDTVIFGAYDVSYLALIKAFRVRNVPNIGFLWTSPIAQTEMEPFEWGAVQEIKRFVDLDIVDFVWFGSPDWLNLFPNEPKKYFTAPYPISLKRYRPGDNKKSEEIDNVPRISLFGPLHYRKNVFNQLTAAKSAGVIVHMNRMEERHKAICSAFGVNFVSHPWMEEQEYFRTIQMMSIGLQVSHIGVESNSYVFFDHMLMNVPCLTSVDWAPSELQMKPNDIHGMAQKITRREDLTRNYRDWVVEYAKQVNQIFNQTFNERGL